MSRWLPIGWFVPCLVLAACGGDDGVTDPTPTISVAVEPTALTLAQGEAGSVTVSIARSGGFTGVVELVVEGAPDGLMTSVDPSSVAGNAATLQVSAAADLSSGTYPLTVRGVGDGGSGADPEDAAALSVTVEGAAPSGLWAEVSAGGLHSCGVTTSGEAYCWGYNVSGQLGNGTQGTSQDATPAPTRVQGSQVWASISAGSSHTCGLTTTGAAYCWGLGSSGQLGHGGTPAAELAPVLVAAPGGVSWQSITAARFHTCALTTGGQAYCWGNNGHGQLGTGDQLQRAAPVLVVGGHTWSGLTAGGNHGPNPEHTCGITTGGETYCWGSNAYGQLGNGAVQVAAHPEPQLVTGDHDFVHVDAGAGHNCALTATGAGFCWGYDNRGQLGDGDLNEQQPSPTPIGGTHAWAEIEGGYMNTCAVTPAGDAYCWGQNGRGQVGNGITSESQIVPAAVSGGLEWAQVSPGVEHTCGTTTNGDAYCWGYNRWGTLGDGNTGDGSSTPVRVEDPQ